MTDIQLRRAVPPGCTPYTVQCAQCGNDIETYTEADLTDPDSIELVNFLATRTKMLCDGCHEDYGSRQSAWRRANLGVEWSKICPADFRGTKKQELPKPAKLDEVLQWKFGPKGLLLAGPAGRGKSRCAWKLAEREYFSGRGVMVMDCMFGAHYAAKFNASAANVLDWLDGMCRADLLLMDDTFKTKLTDSAEAAIFAIVNYRCENQLPFILTTQELGDDLVKRMTLDRGTAMVRRLREYCKRIEF